MANFNPLKPHFNQIANYLSPLLLLLLMACCGDALSQKRAITLTGVVYNKTGAARVAGVTLTDIANNNTIITDDLGTFKINCSIDDTLLFKKQGLTDQKIRVMTDFVLVVYMQPNIVLNQVDIKDVTKKQELNDVMADYGKKGVYNGGNATVWQNIFSPLNALFNIFGSDAKNARRFQKDATSELQQQEISRKFTLAMVQQITGLKDVKLKNFMDSYRPSYQDCKNWNEYDEITYIKKSYAQFEKDGEPALPKLY